MLVCTDCNNGQHSLCNGLTIDPDDDMVTLCDCADSAMGCLEPDTFIPLDSDD